MNRNLYAVYVQRPSESPTAIDGTTQRYLSETSIVFTCEGEDIVDTCTSPVNTAWGIL